MSFNSKSAVWNYFKYEENAIKVKCNVCSCFISRGGTGKKASTSPLLNHLRRKHSAEYAKMNSCDGKDQDSVQSTDAAANTDDPSASLKKRRLEQPTLETVLEKKRIWDINNPKAVELHYAIGQMIAVDNQPYIFVEDDGFRNLMAKAQPQYKVPSREYFKQVIIPKMYSECKENITSELSSSTYISLTTDIWSNSVNRDSFISFTAHWIDDEYIYRHVVLSSRHFPGSHTGENVSKMLSSLSDEWNVKNKIYLVIRDGGSNIVKGVNDLNLQNETCFLHNLHLVVTDALNSQRAVKDIIALGRRIVGHFNHSSLACSKFKDIQEKQLHVQYKKVVQDVPTRWNSTFYMLSRLLELKNAISLYVNENSEIQNFTSYQWTLIENCVKLLQPFEEITKQISCSNSLISEVIPMVVTLQRYLSKSADVSGIGTTKDTLEKNIHKRFSTIQLNKHYSLATILDPRFKLYFFDKDQGYDEVVKTLLLSLMKELEFFKDPGNVTSISHNSKSENSEAIQAHESFWDVFSEITNTKMKATETESDSNEVTSVAELNQYLSQPVIERKTSPLSWWKKNENSFPILSKLVKKYLSPPSSSVYSERLFSEAGIIYEQKRNRLLPKNAEQLLFLHHNLPILKNDKRI